MEPVRKIIRELMKKNSKELKQDLITIKDVKKIYEENKNFDFNIKMHYDLDTQLLDISYEFAKDNREVYVYFQTSELNFHWNAIKISTALIDFAISHFNNKDFKIVIDEDMHEGGIKEYMRDFLDEKELAKFVVLDEEDESIL